MTSKSKTVKSKAALAVKGKPKAPAKVVKAIAAKAAPAVKAKPLPVKTVKQIEKTVKTIETVAAEQAKMGNTITAGIISKTAKSFKKAIAKSAKKPAVKKVAAKPTVKAVAKAAVKPEKKLVTVSEVTQANTFARSKLMPASAPVPKPAPKAPVVQKHGTISMRDLAASVQSGITGAHTASAPAMKVQKDEAAKAPFLRDSHAAKSIPAKGVSIQELFSRMGGK